MVYFNASYVNKSIRKTLISTILFYFYVAEYAVHDCEEVVSNYSLAY